MAESIKRSQQQCREESNCDYRVGGYCTFREIFRAIFSGTQDKDRYGTHCIENAADTCDLPCKELNKEG